MVGTFVTRGGSRTTATSKMELFVIIVNGFQPLTIITKCSILDVAAVLDPPLVMKKRTDNMSINGKVGQRNMLNDEHDYDYWMHITLKKLPILLECVQTIMLQKSKGIIYISLLSE